MPPDEAKDFDEDISGSFGGVGFEMGIRDNVLTVIAPLKGTPAERAGVLAGDRILKIDGRSTHDMNIDEAVRAIRGEVGSTVELTLAREGVSDYIVLPVTRDTIDIPTLDTKLRDDQVFVISLYNFGATANSQFRSAMREYLASGARGLVIDVRGNPGGYLEGAVDIASWFLPVGKVIVSEEYGDGSKPTVHRSKGYDVVPDDQRIAVLVDGGSASASEILAGALSESGRAKLIGERTFGKGSVQEVVPLTPDTSLKITVARWLTPNGRSLSDAGLDPDLVVVPPKDEESADADVQLDAAAQYVLTGILATSTASTMERT
jgi:carboxyl-terminal processing protease